ncbi:hypothetical protein ACFLZH_00355 [Patescibacteria group bacterium]
MSKLDRRDYSESPQTGAENNGTLLNLLASRKGLIFAILLAAGSTLNCTTSCEFGSCQVSQCSAEDKEVKIKGCNCKE